LQIEENDIQAKGWYDSKFISLKKIGKLPFNTLYYIIPIIRYVKVSKVIVYSP
jgi:hypothetical protein